MRFFVAALFRLLSLRHLEIGVGQMALFIAPSGCEGHTTRIPVYVCTATIREKVLIGWQFTGEEGRFVRLYYFFLVLQLWSSILSRN